MSEAKENGEPLIYWSLDEQLDAVLKDISEERLRKFVRIAAINSGADADEQEARLVERRRFLLALH